MSDQKWSSSLDEFRNGQSANTFPSRRLPPLLPPPVATITQASSIPITLPRLPSMAVSPQTSSASPVTQPAVPPQYYPPHAQSLPIQSGSPQLSNPPTMQYNASSASRQSKKEIKRRTKTGCLTCRARRIKCDEQRPTCRNCTKSKRECQGYDPVFRGLASVQATPSTMQAASQNINYHTPTSIDPTLDNSISPRPLPGEYYPNFQGLLTAPPVSIEDILDVGSGHPPPMISSGVEPTDRPIIAELYTLVYAPFIDKFLETKWFTSRGLDHLFNNPHLVEKYNVLKSRFIYTPASDMLEFLTTQSLEAYIIWETMLLARQVSLSLAATNDPVSSSEVTEGVHDAAKRINVFEALITNQKLLPVDMLPEAAKSGTTSPAGMSALQEQLLSREQNFWHLTSKFCALREDDKPLEDNPVEEIETVLTGMRLLLDSRENRDILYSVAIARHVGHTLATRAATQNPDESTIKQSFGDIETDPASKLRLALKFIQDEATGKGTNQVTQRICGMIVMSWSKR